MDDDRLLEVPHPGDSPPPGHASTSGADLRPATDPSPGDVATRHVATMVSQVALPATEVAAARARVLARLLAAMGADDAAMGADDAAKSLPKPRDVRGRPSRRLTGVVAAAAIVLLSMSTGIGLSSAAADALPSSPLYALKRAEEWVALHTAWSDQRRGEVLVAIAQHRMSEVTTESSQGQSALADTLSGELKTTVLQLIDLTATMSRQHEDMRTVSAGLVGILAAQSSAQATAEQAGDAQLAQALQQARADETAAIVNLGLQLPGGGPWPTNTPTQTSSQGQGQGQSSNMHPTPSGSPTGQPNNGGNGNGQDKSTPTPTETPSSGDGNGGKGGGGKGRHPTVAAAGEATVSSDAPQTATARAQPVNTQSSSRQSVHRDLEATQ